MSFRHTSAMFLAAADRWEPAPGWTGWGDELQQL